MPEVDKETEKDRKLFIGGLHPNATEDDLKEIYGQWGTLIDCVVIRDPYTSRSKKFGFVTYAEPSMLEEAMNNRPHTVAGKEVEAKRAVPRELQKNQEVVPDPKEGKRLFVSGIREEHTEEQLKEHFEQFGVVEKAEIICDQATGQKRGFAFVTFEESAPVDKCIGVAAQLVLVNPIELSSFNLELRSHMVNEHRCDVKKAKSREELKLEEQKRDRRGRDMRTRGGINGGLACVSGGWSSGWNQGQSWNDNGYGGGGYGGGYGNYPNGGYGGPAWNQQPAGWSQGGWSAQGTWQSGPPSSDGYYGSGGSQWTQTPQGSQF